MRGINILKVLTEYWNIDDEDLELELKAQIKENDYNRANAAVIRGFTGERLSKKENGNYERV